MADTDRGLDRLEATCEAIAREGGGVLRWEWDDYIGAALAPFPTGEGARVHAILERHLAGRWTEETLASAPPLAQALAESLGGVLTGQELFASGAEGPPLLFACWWPWGSGDRISVRIGLWRPEASLADTEAMHATLRSWFGLSTGP